MSNHDLGDSETANQSREQIQQPSIGLRILASGVAAVGAIVIVGNAALLGWRMLDRESQVPWSDVPWRFQIWEYQLRLGAMLVGFIGILAALYLRHRRWAMSAILVALAIVLMLANPVLNRVGRHYFAGDSYVIDREDNGDSLVTIDEPKAELPRGRQPSSFSDSSGSGAIEYDRIEQAEKAPGETNSLGMELVLVPAGTFELGSPETRQELEALFPVIAVSTRSDAFREIIESERPQHRVQIRRPFYMGKHNVTYGQFKQFVDSTGYQTEAEKNGKGGTGYTKGDQPPTGNKPHFNWKVTGFPQHDDSPVVNISWNDAVAFCRWLTKNESKTYRPPTDAEWEYACRAGTTTRYWTGNEANDLLKVTNVADEEYFKMILGGPLSQESIHRGVSMGMMVNGDDGYTFTSPIGKGRPNPFGLNDMHGNASTWCVDWYDRNYYSKSPSVDPRGPSSGTLRIVRGGNWMYYPSYCRSASRWAYAPSTSESFIGLRIVRQAPIR